MGKMQREKGKRFEREVAELLRIAGFPLARRGVQFQGGPDSPDVVGIPGVHIECKHVEALNVYAAMAQSEAESAVGEVPIVVHRRNRSVALVTLRLSDVPRFAALVENALKLAALGRS